MFEASHLHPMIVHFPIALLMVGFLAEVIGLFLKKEFFSKAAFYLLLLGSLGVIAAFISGQFAGNGIEESGALKAAMETHETSALITIWLVSIASIVKLATLYFKKLEKQLRLVAFAIFLLGVLSVARTGYYGGNLVYKHAAGVQINLGIEIPD